MTLRAGDLPVTGNRRRYRLNYVVANAFEAAIAAAAVVAGPVYFLDATVRAAASIGQVAQELAPAWSVLYCVGGLLILMGLLRPSPRAELAGLSLLAAAVAINAVAIVLYQGLHGIASEATFLALVASCGGRAYLVWHVAGASVRTFGEGG